ncbi:MAG: hypothetical protein H5U24_06570 [Thioclava marina]|uniref:hypothetical protein n=1 Tax=Thioclava marina TaxID=1915077 RepID=UPI0019A1162E|nr:hypothetical protein [Thioclava marina]MBC7145053.1 hypothetical protein [Thioclava marina]
MKTLKNTFTLVIALLALVVLSSFLFYAWRILAAVVSGAKTLEPTVYVPLTVTLFTASLGLAATLIAQSKNRKREIEAALRERKIAIYLDFLETIEKLILASKPELKTASFDDSEMVIKLVKVRTKAVLWGSPGVLKALNKFSKLGQAQPIATLRAVEDIQREMRKDLGLSNFGLETDFFSKLILSDVSEFDKLTSG